MSDYSIPGAVWDWFTAPVDTVAAGPGGRPNNGPFPNVVPPLPVQAPMPFPAPIHPVSEILSNPEGVAAKAAKAGIKPPPVSAAPTDATGADWSAELMSGSPPAGAKDGGYGSLAKGFGAVTPQESAIAQRPSGSANVSVGSEPPGQIAAKNEALNYLMSLMLGAPGGTAQNLRQAIGSK